MSGSRITINVWIAAHPFPGYLDPVLKMAEEFEQAHPEYRINIEGHDFRKLAADVVEAVECGGRLPDVAEYYYTATQLARDTLGRTGKPYWTSVQRAIAGRTEILGEPVVIDDLVPSARGRHTYRADLTSIPTLGSTILLYSNARLLEAAGLTEPPKTWDEVELAGKAVAAMNGGPPHAITWPIHGFFIQYALAAQGALLVDEDNGRSGRARQINLASDAMLAYAQWWRRLYQDGHYFYSGKVGDWFACLDAFAAQQVAFMPSTSKLTPELTEMGRNSGFDVVASPMPFNANAPHAGAMIAGQSMWLADGLHRSKQDGALAFMQFVINPRNAAIWHRVHGQVPVTGASLDLLDSEGWFVERPAWRVDTEALAAADGSPAVSGALVGSFAAIQDIMSESLEDVVIHGADPDDRFALATAEAQALLDAYNARVVEGPVRRSPKDLTVN